MHLCSTGLKLKNIKKTEKSKFSYVNIANSAAKIVKVHIVIPVLLILKIPVPDAEKETVIL